LLGSGYVIDHCVAAINHERKQERDVLRYRVYMSDVLRCIANGMYKGDPVKKRYYEILHPEPVDNRTGEEIAADIVKRIGLKKADKQA